MSNENLHPVFRNVVNKFMIGQNAVLKPCPFCGGIPDLIDCPESFNAGAVLVECQSCHASGPVVFGVKDDPKPHAIEVWNRRTHDQ